MATRLHTKQRVILTGWRVLHLILRVTGGLILSTPASATPYTPANDADVQKPCPRNGNPPQSAAYERNGKPIPMTLPRWSPWCVCTFLETARAQSDPRYFGYAETFAATVGMKPIRPLNCCYYVPHCGNIPTITSPPCKTCNNW